MSPFFHGGVRPVKKYARPWSLNPRLNPELSKGNARMSILGLPSFETGIQTPVFNGVYPKPSRDDLPNVDEAVVVSSNGNLDSELVKEEPRDIEVSVAQPDATISAIAPTDVETATPEVIGSDAEDSKQLDPVVEVSDEAEVQAPVDENAKEITSPEPTPQPGPVPDEPKLSDLESVQEAESPVIKNFAKDESLGEAAPAIEAAEVEQPQVDEAIPKEVTGAENEHGADDSEIPLDPVDSVTEPAHSEIEQTEDIPAETLPSVSEEPAVEGEEPVHDSQVSDLGPDDQTESVSGPAGLGPLEVIKEEPPVTEEAVTGSGEDFALEAANLQEDKGLGNEAVIGGLEPVDETPEILAADGDEAAPVDDISSQIGVAVTADEQHADEDATPVVEKPEFSGVTTDSLQQPPAFDRKDSMFETPFETPMEKPLNNNIATEEDSTPFETSFETPMERPFWASGGDDAAAAHEPEPQPEPEHLHQNEHEEPAEGPLIPRHSPDLEPTPTTTGDGIANQAWSTDHHDAKEYNHDGNEEEEEHHHIAPSAGTGSAAASATDVEPLLSDEMLDVDDEFKPGLKTQSMDYSTRVYGS